AKHFQNELAPRALLNGSRELGVGADLFAIDRQNAVAREQLAVGGMARQHHADGGWGEVLFAQKHGKVENDRKDQIHDRSGEDDDQALVEGLRFEGALAIFGQNHVGLGLFQHLDEAAERNEAHAVFGFFPAQAQDLGAKSEGEGDDLDPEDLRPRIVTK